MKKKYALVTGGSRGIGRAICVRLAKMGYHILINYATNSEAAKATQALVAAENRTADLLQFDVSDFKAVAEEIQNWQNANPDAVIEILVNNAGIRKDNLMLMMPAAEWEKVLDTNLKSFYYTTRAVLVGMMANKYGRIINIASLSGQKGMLGQTNYSASKAGMIGATKALAQEVGRKNITVNAVAPGFIKTEMVEGIEEQQYKSMIPLQRFGEAEEVAATVGFLASKEAGYITGEVISINGGLYT